MTRPCARCGPATVVACHWTEKVSRAVVADAALETPAVVAADVGDVPEIPLPPLTPPSLT